MGSRILDQTYGSKNQLIKDLNLPGGHFCRLGIAFVIETEQVQHPWTVMCAQCDSRDFPCASASRATTGAQIHKLTQIVAAVGTRSGAAEGQHIGGPVLSPVSQFRLRLRAVPTTRRKDAVQESPPSAARAQTSNCVRRGTHGRRAA